MFQISTKTDQIMIEIFHVPRMIQNTTTLAEITEMSLRFWPFPAFIYLFISDKISAKKNFGQKFRL